MTGFDPRRKERSSGCRFLKVDADGRCVCRIRSGEIPWERLSGNVKAYYRRECEPYPDPNDEAHWPVPPECTFGRVEE
jgi:hypothetical protein